MIFRSPENPTLDLVKRCVAVGGDTVQVINAAALHQRQGGRRRELRHAQEPRPVAASSSIRACGGATTSAPTRCPPATTSAWGTTATTPTTRGSGGRCRRTWSRGGRSSSTGLRRQDLDGQWEGVGAKLRDLAETAVGFFSKTRWGRTFRLIR